MSIRASNAGDPTTTTTTAPSSTTVDSFEIALSHTGEQEPLIFVNLDREYSIDGHDSPAASEPAQVLAVADNGPSEHYGVRITDEQSGDIKLRTLFPQDIPELKEVCSQWFPIE